MAAEEHDQEFVRLLTDHQTAILAYIRSLMPGYPGARDIQQLTNITLWKKKNDFELGTNFKAWAFAVARFQVLSQRRKLRREGWLIFDDELATQFATDRSGGPAEIDESHRALQSCLGKLRERDRILLHKRYAEDVTLDTYASELNRSPGTLKARLFKIRAALRQCIQRELVREGGLA
ncbi:MAG: sigma-70 family RNA polymerase sigma factor [Akkermansiaceae bacterium]|nr:sigma-70 family RNA polymerase sigma factor [Akkermansiaceae bacterium]NNM29603.1 sigma-70 family RNA polymerase sigma factor [Akkermansiaceae bacterium]